MNKNLIKSVGFAATLIGMGATLITDYVNEKKIEEKIEEKVDEALARRQNNEEES